MHVICVLVNALYLAHAECTLGPKQRARVACASAEAAQRLRSQNLWIIDANRQNSDRVGTLADPNLVC